jgi:3-hydroxyacyl-[acyl-carrier-protein] dehydratase
MPTHYLLLYDNMEQQPLLQHAAVSALIPQKPPIEMVDTLWSTDESKTVSGFTIHPENIFCENGKFTEPGIIENIAQTAALRAGYQASRSTSSSGTPLVGYIAAIKNLKIHRLPEAGAVLKTEIFIKQLIFDVTLIDATSFCNQELIAECEMKIFLKKD